MEPIVNDLIEIVPEKSEDAETDSIEFDLDEEDEHLISMNDDIERITDALGGLFVSLDGRTIADILAKMSEALDKQNDILDKQNKVLFRLAKVIEETKK
jgi:hypothetical protein